MEFLTASAVVFETPGSAGKDRGPLRAHTRSNQAELEGRLPDSRRSLYKEELVLSALSGNIDF